MCFCSCTVISRPVAYIKADARVGEDDNSEDQGLGAEMKTSVMLFLRLTLTFMLLGSTEVSECMRYLKI